MTSPFPLPAIALLVLSMALAYCGGAYTAGIWSAVCLIGSGVLGTSALLLTGADAYADGMEEAQWRDDL